MVDKLGQLVTINYMIMFVFAMTLIVLEFYLCILPQILELDMMIDSLKCWNEIDMEYKT